MVAFNMEVLNKLPAEEITDEVRGFGLCFIRGITYDTGAFFIYE